MHVLQLTFLMAFKYRPVAVVHCFLGYSGVRFAATVLPSHCSAFQGLLLFQLFVAYIVLS